MVTITAKYDPETKQIKTEMLLEDENEAPIEKETEAITVMTARFCEGFGNVDAIGYLRGVIADIEDGNDLIPAESLVYERIGEEEANEQEKHE